MQVRFYLKGEEAILTEHNAMEEAFEGKDEFFCPDYQFLIHQRDQLRTEQREVGLL